MEKFTALIFGICVLNAHCAVYSNADNYLHRQVRSPHYGGALFGPPPPGPPPPGPPTPFIYHTHNWSGVSRGYGGRSNGVFSGAAAAAGSAPPTSGETLALATADASSGQSANCDDTASNLDQSSQYVSKSGQLSSKSFGSGSSHYGGQIKSSGSGLEGGQSGHLQGGFSESNSNSAAIGKAGSGSFSGGSGTGGFSDFGGQLGEFKSQSSGSASSSTNGGFSGKGQQNNRINGQVSGVDSGFPGSNGGFQGGQNYKEAHFSSEGHGGQFGAQQGDAGSLSQRGFSGHQQASLKEFRNSQSQSSSFGNAGSSNAGSQGSGFAKLDAGLSETNQASAEPEGQFTGAGSGISSGFAYGHQGHGNSHYHAGQQQEQQQQQQLQSGGNFRKTAGLDAGLASGGQALSSFGVSGASRDNGHSAFNGALELASQGLQAADKAGCSTCQKSSYALSNAKSYNGNAISLAIGG